MAESTRTPKEGDILLLDGFEYVLGAGKKQLHDDGRTVTIRSFKRPVAATVGERTAHQQNFSYKKDGTLLEHDLVWVEPAQMIADLKAQANQLIRGNPRLVAWADGAVIVQEAALATRKTGAWVLPDRHLMKPPVQLQSVVTGAQPDGTPIEQKREVVVLPSRVADATTVASAILGHTYKYDTTKKEG